MGKFSQVGVTVGCETAVTLGEELVRSSGITTEFWQHIGVTQRIVYDAVVTTVVEGARVAEFQTGKRQTSFVTVLRV
ncbi:hypothetical protein CFNIH1_14715 [Citrobacter freundii CFNIH1]|nr:hypothetical protein CFNIH1_14715 [Citrobacter freundii CFNIH1]